MQDVIITGASRGIGRALAIALAGQGVQQWLVARDPGGLAATAARIRELGGRAECVSGDLGQLASARELGHRLGTRTAAGSMLIHNAGIWPSKRTLGPDGLEQSFVVNFLGPLAMQQPLLEQERVGRIMVISAGLIIKGRFDPQRTPTGDDFSALRTYCTTKLCFAVAMRQLAKAHPELDVVVLHPGVVRTALGARSDPLGWLLWLAKRVWESPECCAARLAGLVRQDRWSPAGAPRWFVENKEQPWPSIAGDQTVISAITSAARDALTAAAPKPPHRPEIRGP